MNTQDVAAAIAPWLAVLTGLIGFVAAIRRTRGVERLRDGLARDAEIRNALPDGNAQKALDECLEHQASLLRDRVLGVTRPSKLQFVALMGLLFTACGLGLAGIAAADREWPEVFRYPEWLMDITRVLGISAATAGLLILGIVAIAAVMWWLDKQAVRLTGTPATPWAVWRQKRGK